MRRSIARGRVFPQSYSTDRRYGRLSLKACALFPLMWVNGDDQGRLCGDPEEIKYAVCPNIDHITKADIPDLLKELESNKLIKAYDTPKSRAIQFLDWWDIQKPQWAWPSQYSPPDGWQDHLRYKRGAKEVVAINWNVSGESPSASQVSTSLLSGEFSPEEAQQGFSHSPNVTEIRKKNTKEEYERGNSPENSGENSGEKIPSPTPTEISTDIHKILDNLLMSFRLEFGRVPAETPDKIIPREPTPRERAQIRDLAEGLVKAGGCPLNYIREAFREAAGHQKLYLSYARAILLDWLGVERNRSP